MNNRKKYERLQNSPAWFKKTVLGLDKSHNYSVHLSGKHYAIIKCDGFSWFTNAFGGMKYEPVNYILVEKGKNYWVSFHARVWEGRLTKRAELELKSLLKDFNRTGLSRVEKVRQRTNLRSRSLRREHE